MNAQTPSRNGDNPNVKRAIDFEAHDENGFPCSICGGYHFPGKWICSNCGPVPPPITYHPNTEKTTCPQCDPPNNA